MSSNPLVSIIAVCYNHTPYCIETLQSIKNQSFRNFELIIVDDCSKDNSTQIIDSWIERNTSLKIKFIKHQVNNGICKSLNEALAHANGKYLSIIACDDIMLKDKINKQVELIESLSSEYYGIYSDAYVINDISLARKATWLEITRCKFPPEGDVFQRLINMNFILLQSQLIRKSVFQEIGAFDEQLTFEDYDFNLRANRRYKIKYSPYISVMYRKHSTGTSIHLNSYHGISYIKALAKHLDTEYVKDVQLRIRQRVKFAFYQSYNQGRVLSNYVDENLRSIPQTRYFMLIPNIAINYLAFKLRHIINFFIYPKRIFKYSDGSGIFRLD